MNNIVQLLTTTEGRISRKSWWLGVVILAVATMGLLLVGFGIRPNVAAFETGDAAAINEALAANTRWVAGVNLISFIILVYPSYALSMKRRHDRDNNGVDLQIYYGLAFVLLLLPMLGIGYEQMPLPAVEGMTVLRPGMIVSALGLVMGVFGIYMLVVMGFLRGTIGPNQYGPDPLGAAAPAAA